MGTYNNVWLHFYEIERLDESIETEERSVPTRSFREEKMGSCHDASLEGDKNVLELGMLGGLVCKYTRKVLNYTL